GARDVVALDPQLLREVAGLPEAVAFDVDLPRRIAALEQLLLGVGLRWVIVPALLVMQPAFGHEARRREARLLQFLLDDTARLLGLHPRRRVHEHRVAVTPDGQAMFAPLVGKPFRVMPG